MLKVCCFFFFAAAYLLNSKSLRLPVSSAMPLNSTDVEQQKPHHKTTKPPKPRDPLLRNENQAPPSARAGK